jgi:polysaccharide pyruvyl transferase CsaB
LILAKLCGAKSMIFAQGLGPLNTAMGKTLTRGAMATADLITVRDAESAQLLQSWNINASLTADPVWSLAAKPLPPQLAAWQANRGEGLRVALSLRSSKNITGETVALLAAALAKTLPEDATVIPLALQPLQDDEILDLFEQHWRALNRKIEPIDTSSITLPSQWISLLQSMDIVVSMRLHCAIMALISAVPTVAIAYDPKVSHVAREFELPTLNLTKAGEADGGGSQWTATLKAALDNRESIAATAARKAQAARNAACQNFSLLAKILNIDSSP